MASILIIDDEINIIKSFESLFSGEHEVYSAVNGKESLDILKMKGLILYFWIITSEARTDLNF